LIAYRVMLDGTEIARVDDGDRCITRSNSGAHVACESRLGGVGVAIFGSMLVTERFAEFACVQARKMFTTPRLVRTGSAGARCEHGGKRGESEVQMVEVIGPVALLIRS